MHFIYWYMVLYIIIYLSFIQSLPKQAQELHKNGALIIVVPFAFGVLGLVWEGIG
jgi:hypothetical protein